MFVPMYPRLFLELNPSTFKPGSRQNKTNVQQTQSNRFAISIVFYNIKKLVLFSHVSIEKYVYKSI